jgi:hypothetical protein
MDKIISPLRSRMQGPAVADLQDGLQLLLDRRLLLRENEATRNELAAALKEERIGVVVHGVWAGVPVAQTAPMVRYVHYGGADRGRWPARGPSGAVGHLPAHGTSRHRGLGGAGRGARGGGLCVAGAAGAELDQLVAAAIE